MLTAEMVRRVRAFTGHGLLAVKRALEACDGDELLACGYLRYEGSLINLKGGDRGHGCLIKLVPTPNTWKRARMERFAFEMRILPHNPGS